MASATTHPDRQPKRTRRRTTREKEKKCVSRVKPTHLYAECGHILMQRTNLIVQLCNASSFLTRIAPFQIQTFQWIRFGTYVYRRCDWPLPFDTLTHRRQRFPTANGEGEREKARAINAICVCQCGRGTWLTRWELNQYLPLQEFAMPWTRYGMQWRTQGTFGGWCICHELRIDIRLIFIVLANWWQHQRWPNIWFGLCNVQNNPINGWMKSINRWK